MFSWVLALMWILPTFIHTTTQTLSHTKHTPLNNDVFLVSQPSRWYKMKFYVFLMYQTRTLSSILPLSICRGQHKHTYKTNCDALCVYMFGFFPPEIWVTVTHLCDRTTRAILHSSSASVRLGWSPPINMMTVPLSHCVLVIYPTSSVLHENDVVW